MTHHTTPSYKKVDQRNRPCDPFNFEEYIRQGEPGQQEKVGYWQTAIGLQAVDGLKVSRYLQDTARKHIEGDITIDEARELVNQYYITRTAHDANDVLLITTLSKNVHTAIKEKVMTR